MYKSREVKMTETKFTLSLTEEQIDRIFYLGIERNEEDFKELKQTMIKTNNNIENLKKLYGLDYNELIKKLPDECLNEIHDIFIKQDSVISYKCIENLKKILKTKTKKICETFNITHIFIGKGGDAC